MTYEYDDLYRLTEESRSGSNSYTTSYTYDLAGNITEINGSSWASYDDSNKFSSVSGGSAGYNPIGCLNAISGTGLQQAAYRWGTRLEMRTQFNGTSSSSDKTEYLYDAFMRRVYRKADNDNNKRAWYIFNGTQLVGEMSPSGPTLAYTWGPDGLVSRTWTGNGTTRYYHFGPQGETQQLTDASGNVVDTYRYDAPKYFLRDLAQLQLN